MRVLFAGHALVIPANQALCCELERLPDVELALLAPATWRASLGGATTFCRHEALRAEAVTKAVRFSGKMQLHYYRGLRKGDLPWLPDLIFVDEEAYSVACSQLLGLARRLRVPLVFRTNQNIIKHYPPPFAWMEQAVYRYAAAALPCAKACEDVLRAKGYAGRTEIVGFGLDPAILRYWPREVLRERLGIAPDAFVVGFMGRFTPAKGPMDVLDACVELIRWVGDHEALGVLMVGDGPQRQQLLSRAAALPRNCAVFPGAVPHGREAAEHLSCMDVCVVPSRTTAAWREQFGRVIIEAMACGVPVIGSDSGNVPVLIAETAGGIVFPEGDISALAECIRDLMENRERARTLGETGRQYVVREYCYRRLAEKMAGVFRSLV